jgi:hypothetical protein
MKHLKSSADDLRELFDQHISVRYVAEHLASFDEEADASGILSFMKNRDFDAVGIRRQGHVIGYVEREDLANGVLVSHIKDFSEGDLIDDSDPLLNAFMALRHSERLFVRVLGRVGGIVTRGDMQKAPARMWLFGVITLVEMHLLRIIRYERLTQTIPGQKRRRRRKDYKRPDKCWLIGNAETRPSIWQIAFSSVTNVISF